MSGYLARLAARGGGAPAAAGPRLPSRFEPSTIDTRPTGPTGPEQATAPVPSPDTLVRDGRRSSVQLAATRADERAAAATRTSGDAVAALPIPADRGRQAHGAEAQASVPALPTSAAFEARRTTERGDPVRRATEDVGPPPPATAVAAASPRVDAAPLPEPAGATTAVPARDAASRAPEPDVVHVTIGRVEVRATIAAQTPAPRPPRDAERALHDYLAGRTR